MTLALELYDVVLSVHIMAVVVAFGVVFAYPVLFGFLRTTHPGALAAAHEVQGRIGKLVITPAATVALIAGIYLAQDRDSFSKVWVQVPFAILIVIFGISGAFFAPQERRLAELAAGGTATAEYAAAAKRLQAVQIAVAVGVLVAIFFMAAKPGGYD